MYYENEESSFNVISRRGRACYSYKHDAEAGWKIKLISLMDKRPQGEILEMLINEYWEIRKTDVPHKLTQKQVSKVINDKVRKFVNAR